MFEGAEQLKASDCNRIHKAAHLGVLTCRATVHPATSCMHFRQSRSPVSVNACLYWKGLTRLDMAAHLMNVITMASGAEASTLTDAQHRRLSCRFVLAYTRLGALSASWLLSSFKISGCRDRDKHMQRTEGFYITHMKQAI